MSNLKVAFQGEMGAYSHIACEKLFPGSAVKACPTFEETFKQAYNDPEYKEIVESLTKELYELRIKYNDSETLDKKFLYN